MAAFGEVNQNLTSCFKSAQICIRYLVNDMGRRFAALFCGICNRQCTTAPELAYPMYSKPIRQCGIGQIVDTKTLPLLHMVRCANSKHIEKGDADTPMNDLLYSYLPIVVFMGLAAVIALALMLAPLAIAFKAPDPEKLSAYECGFNAFDDARMKFDVRFYLVSILFIIFDLEVAFLFPWAISLGKIGLFGFWSMIVFLGVLTVGFIYEWRKGALEWD